MITNHASLVGEKQLKMLDKNVLEKLGVKLSPTKKQIWIPKAIGIVSTNPYYEFFGSILLDIWFTLIYDGQSSAGLPNRGVPFPFEHIVKQLVHQLPPNERGLRI